MTYINYESAFNTYYINPDGSVEGHLAGLTGFTQDQEWIDEVEGNRVIMSSPSSPTGWKETVKTDVGAMVTIVVDQSDFPKLFAMRILTGAV